MSYIILDIESIDTTGLKGMRKELTRIKKETLKETADWFRRHKVAPHFGPANRRRYGHEPRNKVYANEIKKRKGTGQGRFVDNRLSGKSARQARYLSRISGSSKQATLTVTVPTYFRRPYVGSFTKTVKDANGRTRQVTKRVTRQPDKVAELLRLDQRDKEDTRKFSGKLMLRKIKALRKQRRTTIRG